MTYSGYKAQQARSFAYVGTIATEWRNCDIIGMDDEEQPVFEVPQDYEVVSPFSEMMPKEERSAALAKIAYDGWKTLCELCGHGINHPWPIRHDVKKLVMYVGSECVNNFMGAGFHAQELRKFREKQIREKFKIWLPIAIQDCFTFKDDRNRLQYEYFKFKKKLVAIKNDGQDGISILTTRKIKAIFRQANKLGISAPR